MARKAAEIGESVSPSERHVARLENGEVSYPAGLPAGAECAVRPFHDRSGIRVRRIIRRARADQI